MKTKNNQILTIMVLAILSLFLLNACGGSKKTQKTETPENTTKPKAKPKPKPKNNTTTKPTKPKPKPKNTNPADTIKANASEEPAEDAFTIGEEKDKWGEDSLKTVENYSLYREFFKQGAYTDAIPYWKYVYQNAPSARKTPLMNGEQMYKKMMEEQIEMAICKDGSEAEIIDGKIKKSLCKKSKTGGFKEWKLKDPEKFKAAFDTIIHIYNTRVKYFGERGYMTTKRVRLYDKYLPKEEKIINKLRETALEQEAEDASYDILYGYFKNQLSQLEKEEITPIEIVEIYDDKLIPIIDYNIENNEKYGEKYQKYGDKMANKIEILRAALAEEQEGIAKVEKHKLDSAEYVKAQLDYAEAVKARETAVKATEEYETALKAAEEFKTKMAEIEKQREAITEAQQEQAKYKALLAERAKQKAEKEAQRKEYEEKIAALKENDTARKEYEQKLADLKESETENDAYLKTQQDQQAEYLKKQDEYKQQLADYEKAKKENEENNKKLEEARKIAEEARQAEIRARQLAQQNAPKKPTTTTTTTAAPTSKPRSNIKVVTTCAEAKESYNKGEADDKANVKRLVSRLQRLQCKSDPMFITGLEKLQSLEPTASRARVIAQYYFYEKKNTAKAIDYYQKAIKLETDRTKNAKVYMSLAIIERRKSKNLTNANAKRAREYAKKAAQLNPGWGKPYMFIGNLYASSGPLCGTGRGWKSQVVTWVATDMWQKSKNIDPAFTEEANKAIANYAQYYPTTQDGFMNGGVKHGDSFKIPCWINATTTARLRKE